ncbi:MAG: mycofactocin biosynthesis chaperone MftB [Actinomycetota bacterium]
MDLLVTDDASAVDFERRWRLHPRVALRPEPFGALAYHYDNRRLNFLRSPDLVALVKQLEEHPTPRHGFDATDIDQRRWPAFRKALEALAVSDFLQPADDPQSQPPGDQ